MANHAWMVRPPQIERRGQVAEFKEGGYIGIGMPELGNLAGCSRTEIKELLARNVSEDIGHDGKIELGSTLASVDALVNHMEPEDYVLIPDGENIYFAVIAGDYGYHEEFARYQLGMVHQRPIVRFTSAFSRSELSMGLRSSLKARRAITNISKHYAEVKAFAEGTDFVQKAIKSIPVSIPIRPDFFVKFSVPEDMTESEAIRLSLIFQNIYFGSIQGRNREPE